jgi:DNA-binding response OmpR family regulator
VKELPELREIPFVILTSLSRDLRERSTQAGADTYLFKLNDDRAFPARVRMLLELGVLREAFPGPLSGPSGRVLLLTGNPGLQVQLQSQLAGDGVEVLPAGDAEAALAIVHGQGVALLVLDLETWVPEPQWLEAVAAPGGFPAPVLLAIEGRTGPGLPRPARVQDLLQKPLDAQETRHRIRLLLQLALARRAAFAGRPPSG